MQISPDTLPNYHFVYIGPGLDPRWLFEAARRYYEAFRPTVLGDPSLLALIPPESTVAVTAVLRRDTLRTFAVTLETTRPTALFDALVVETLEEARLTLDGRAELYQPFGVPLLPTEVPPTAEPIVPTPGAIPVQDASGFITQTPTPTATPPPQPTEPVGDQISPTPGSIFGGD